MIFRLFFAAFLVVLAPLQALADPPKPTLAHNSNSIWFDNWIGVSNATLRVASPAGEIETIFEKTRSPVYRLSGARIADGVYRFELRAATDERIPNTDKTPSFGDEERPETLAKPLYLTGAFLVERGAIVVRNETEERDGG